MNLLFNCYFLQIYYFFLKKVIVEKLFFRGATTLSFKNALIYQCS